MIDSKIQKQIHDVLAGYGKLLTEYYGNGEITYQDGNQYKCDFGIGQLTNGTIYFVAFFTTKGFTYTLGEPDKKFNFYGKTENDYLISFHTKGFIKSVFVPFFVYLIQFFKVDTGNNYPIQNLNFGLTNFLFTGNNKNRTELTVNLPDSKPVIFKKFEKYEEISFQLRDKESINVTSELIIPLKSAENIEQIKSISQSICFLLSICRGSKIFWIYYSCFDESGTLIYRIHENTVTHPMSSFPELISSEITGVDATKFFLERSYQKAMDNPYLMKYVSIFSNIFVDARIGKGYSQSQSLKLVVLMEILVKYVLEDPLFQINSNILNSEERKKLIRELKKIIHQFISDKSKKEELEDNVNGINRTSFRKLITRLCEKIELKMDKSDIELFVKSRNKLIHTGNFYCEIANDDERKKIPPLSSDFEEYRFIINFVDKILLKLFNYSGDYANVRKDWNHSLKDKI